MITSTICLRLVESLQSRSHYAHRSRLGRRDRPGCDAPTAERLKRIVLFNTGAFPPRYIPWRIRVCRGPVLGRLAVQGGNLFSLAALRMTLARRRNSNPRSRPDTSPHTTPGPTAERFTASSAISPRKQPTKPGKRSLEIERDLPSLANLPICLVWGMRDWCFRPDCLDRFLEAWPQAEAHRLADVGHWVA